MIPPWTRIRTNSVCGRACVASVTWVMFMFSFVLCIDGRNLTETIHQTRCLARCYDKYAESLTQTRHGAEVRSFLSCDTIQACLECTVPCNSSLWTSGNDCDDICKAADSPCMESCSHVQDSMQNGQTTIQTDDGSFLSDYITNVSVICKALPSYGQMCQGDVASVFLGWNVVNDVAKAHIKPETVLYIVTSHLSNATVNSDDICSSPWTQSRIVSDTYVEMDHLKCATSYRFCVTPVTMSGLHGSTKTSPQTHTHGPDDRLQTPRSIAYDIRIIRQKPAVKISWDPGDDPSCYFRLYILSLGTEEQLRVGNVQTPRRFEYQFEDLAFSVDHIVKLYTYDRAYRNSSNSSCDITFVTPDCLGSTNYNFSVCPPKPPQNLTLSVLTPDHENESTSSVNVSLTWEPPYRVQNPDDIISYSLIYRKEPPQYAAVLIVPHHGRVITNSSQREVTLELHNHNVYRFILTAESKGGQGTPAVLAEYIDFNSTNQSTKFAGSQSMKFWEIVTFVLVPVLFITIIVFIVVIVVLRKKHLRRQRKRSKRAGPVEEFNPIYETVPNHYQSDEPLLGKSDGYEIDYNCLDFIAVIGEGAFGKVVKAEYYRKSSDRKRGKRRVVAVKMLKDYHTGDESRSFLREIQAMKSLGHHPYIVSIIGCCVTGPKLCLIMDYCALGDLRNYLRKYREKLMFNSPLPFGKMTRYNDVKNDLMASSDSGVSRTSVASSYIDTADSNEINEAKLLSYARQISIGMEFLETRRFVHRDLAARNILLYDHRHIKISDFGLSRDVYETNVYQPTSARKLPYKWMAIESLFSQKFTTKSDVWSFGIVLWEIVTLGGSPYPSIPLKDLYGLLEEGYRMEKPENCSPQLYKIMLSAWHPNPQTRPSFTQVRKDIESLLEETQSYIDLSVEVSQDFFDESTTESQGETNPSDTGTKGPDNSEKCAEFAQNEQNEYIVDIHDQPLLNKCSSNESKNTSPPSKLRAAANNFQLKPNSHISKSYLSDTKNKFFSDNHLPGSNCACSQCDTLKRRIRQRTLVILDGEKRQGRWAKDSFNNLLDKIGHQLKATQSLDRKRSISLDDIDASTAVAQL